jgi:hypothetical protein
METRLEVWQQHVDFTNFINTMLCRLIVTSSCSRFEGLGCSPMKTVRELGSERRKLLATWQSDLLDKIDS